MFFQKIVYPVLLGSIVLAACNNQRVQNENQTTNTEMLTDTPIKNNPLFATWDGPHGGLPPFDQVKVYHFQPALEAAMAENQAEIEQIAGNPAAPDFENTIAALERSGQTLHRVLAVYYVWSSNKSDSAFQAIEKVMEPELTAFSDQIMQNEDLFKRVETVYNTSATGNAGLTDEQQRLTWLYYTNFVRAGARLDSASKAEVAAINRQLASLYTRFSQNLLADESQQTLLLETEKDFAGLPQSLRDAAKEAAREKGKKDGQGLIYNTRSSIDPFLTYSENRDLREKAWKMFVNRGDNGDANDNNEIIQEILKLRAIRARLLGYKTHAHWRLENTMAKSPEKAMKLMEDVWKPAVARVKEEVADMQLLATKEGQKITIEPWDYKFYAEKVRKERYDLDQNEVKEYLQLDKLRDAMFWVAGQLFDFEFKEVDYVPVFHPDVRVWEVLNQSTGAHVGYWYFDAFARPGKRSGAWMTAYRDQHKLDGPVTTLVSNNSNFVKGKEGEPVLISWDDATTLFHEFGHALHGLSSDVTYPTLSGTSVVRDYVEFPSQLLEHWLSTPEVLQNFALHYKTGEPIPQDIVDRIRKASTFNQGFATTEYLASGLVDMKLHLAGEQDIDPDAFEKTTLQELGMPKELVMRHRTPQFAHIFSGDSYSAGYYSYLWSDVLTADAYTAFTEGKGPYDKEVAGRLKKYVFSAGNTVDPEKAYKAFRGREPDTKALMKKRGFLKD